MLNCKIKCMRLALRNTQWSISPLCGALYGRLSSIDYPTFDLMLGYLRIHSLGVNEALALRELFFRVAIQGDQYTAGPYST